MTAGRPNYNKIKAMLALKGKSNEELAGHLGKTPTTVASWCTNKIQPSVLTIFEIAEYLEVDPGELLTPLKDFKRLAPKVKEKIRTAAKKTVQPGKGAAKPEK